MSLNPFTWIRNASRNAVMLGVGDALVELAPDGGAALTLEDLRTRLSQAPALPPAIAAAAAPAASAADGEPAKGRRAKSP